jgi:branched-chain amino acid transport system ATP-binding protein
VSLELKHVTKRFGGLRAVGDVSFSVPERSIFGLIGPNGAGKTTVFNLVTGVYKPDEGSITFAGEDLGPHKPAVIARRGIGRTFQNIRLFGQLSVLENVLVACENKRKTHLFGALLRSPAFYRDEDEMTKRALELLRIFDLDGVAHEPSTSLSYGNQRRLEIARAMMLDPKLLLLDEPAAGMNYGEAEGLKKQIRWLRDEFELTVVLVEHNMQVVMGVCEEIHVLDHGETIAHGTPERGAEAPQGDRRLPRRRARRGLRASGRGPRVKTSHPTRPPPRAPEGEVLLDVRDLAVSYGGIRALRGITLEVRRGEIVAMIGANGAGKSTTLKTIARLLPGQRGTLTLRRREPRRARRRRRGGASASRSCPRGAPSSPTSPCARTSSSAPGTTRARPSWSRPNRRRGEALPAARRAHEAGGRHALRRRAADARHRPRDDGAPRRAPARRALPRHRAAPRRRHLRGHRAHRGERARPSCSSSRTRASRSSIRSAPTCCARARSR